MPSRWRHRFTGSAGTEWANPFPGPSIKRLLLPTRAAEIVHENGQMTSTPRMAAGPHASARSLSTAGLIDLVATLFASCLLCTTAAARTPGTPPVALSSPSETLAWLQPVMSKGPSGCLDPARSSSIDVRRHQSEIRAGGLCWRRELVREGPFRWRLNLIENPQQRGPFWVLPHDNENAAFAAAIHAVRTYGGGFVAIDSGGGRTVLGQDPNRNFSRTRAESARCSGQRRPAPKFTAALLRHYRPNGTLPYLSLHNNAEGWRGNGGRGNLSLYRRERDQWRFPAPKASGDLADEDNLVFIAGRTPYPANPAARRIVTSLGRLGLNVIYKQVTERNFDCSMSDYVTANRLGDYYNIEAQHGHLETQKLMIDRLMQHLGQRPIERRSPRGNQFLSLLRSVDTPRRERVFAGLSLGRAGMDGAIRTRVTADRLAGGAADHD